MNMNPDHRYGGRPATYYTRPEFRLRQRRVRSLDVPLDQLAREIAEGAEHFWAKRQRAFPQHGLATPPEAA